MALVDIILGYDCNPSCDDCTITPQMRQRSLTTQQIREIAALRRSRGLRWSPAHGG